MKDLIICVQLYLLLLIKARFKMDMHIQMLNVNDKLRSPGGLMKLIMSRDIVTKDEDMCGKLYEMFLTKIFIILTTYLQLARKLTTWLR